MKTHLNRLALSKAKEIRYYQYREANVVSPLFEMHFEGEETDEYSRIQKRLCEKAGVIPDNHTVFVIDGLGVEFSDHVISIGLEIRKNK